MKKVKAVPADKKPLVDALLEKARMHFGRNEYPLVEQLANEVLRLSSKDATVHKESVASALCFLGECCRYTARYDEALRYFDEALIIAESISNIRLQARALHGTAFVEMDQSAYTTSLPKAERALTLAEKAGDVMLQCHALTTIGSVSRNLGDYARALDCFTRVHSISVESNLKGCTTAALCNLASLYSHFPDLPRSLETFAKALAIAEETGNRDQMNVILGNIGLTYFQAEDYPHAMEYLKRALAIDEEIGARKPAGYWLTGIARVEFRMGNFDAAYKGFQHALHYRRTILKSNEDVAEILLALGGVLIEQGKAEEGLVYLEEALSLADLLGERMNSSHAHEDISSVYAKMGDMAQAYEHITKHNSLEKEIFTEESKKKVDAFNMRTAIAEQEKATEVQKLKSEHLEEEMKIQQEELSNKALLLVQQTDMLQTLRVDLNGIVGHAESAEKAIRSIREKLKEIPEHLLNWEKFSKEFRKVHPNFERDLVKKNPTLSKAEVKVACLLRIGMSTREISTLLFLSERTVEIHRQHIRKKLEIKKGVDVHEVLAAF